MHFSLGTEDTVLVEVSEVLINTYLMHNIISREKLLLLISEFLLGSMRESTLET